ncbi:ABC transporter ATP-binding protein [Kribbella sp. CA-253562]|uniref:ABC transporter ATP-binding protein n=1 Tax=Kribbella sp. CA-253562 TaxID=3239942 RepID=UPI003D8B14F9
MDVGLGLLRKSLLSRRREHARLVLWTTGQTIPAVLSGYAIGRAVDEFAAGRVAMGLGALVLLGVAAIVGAVATALSYGPLSELVEAVHDDFLIRVVRGSIQSAALGGPRPDLSPVTGVTAQMQSLRGLTSVLLRATQHLIVTVAGVFIGLALLAPPIALIAAGFVVASFGLFVISLPWLSRRNLEVLMAEEEVSKQAGDALTAARDLIAMGTEDRAVAEVQHAIDAEAARSVGLARAQTSRMVFTFFGAQGPLIVLLAAAPWLVGRGSVTIGEVVGAAAYLVTTLEPALRSLLGSIGVWGLEIVVLVRRLGGRFAISTGQGRDMLPGPSDTRIDLSSATFSYSSQAKPVIRDLSLSIPPGDHLAVVGPSGIGKSTLAALVAALIEPTAGTVQIGGVEVGRIRDADLRRLVGYIPQEAYVFAGTLRENLCYLSPHSTDEGIWHAAKAVGSDHVIARLGGLQAMVGASGAELSGGEKQLVALTRLYLSPCRVVLLDEATSLLDPVAEERAEAAFASRPGTTLIVIAHRLTSAARARRILAMDGHDYAIGTHEDLMQSSALYAAIAHHWDLPASVASTEPSHLPSLVRAGRDRHEAKP